MHSVSSVHRGPRSLIALLAAVTGLICVPLEMARAQGALSECATYRAASTVVGTGLGAVIGAIPATVAHRGDKRTSHRIMAVSISGGAIAGLVGSWRGHPCTSPASDAARAPDPIVSARERHSWKGALVGAVAGGVLGAIGGTQFSIGCLDDPCNPVARRRLAILGTAGFGAFTGGVLGSLVGWALPVH